MVIHSYSVIIGGRNEQSAASIREALEYANLANARGERDVSIRYNHNDGRTLTIDPNTLCDSDGVDHAGQCWECGRSGYHAPDCRDRED